MTDGVDGLLYDSQSSTALANALRSLVDNRQRLERFKQNLPSVKSIETDAKEWEDLYAESIDRARVDRRTVEP